MPVIGKHEILALLVLAILIGLTLINKPFCAVCFFEKKPEHFLRMPKGSITQGIITSEPKVGYNSQRIIVSLPDGEHILVVGNRYQRFSYGDSLSVQGDIGRPENIGTFDYAAYLLRQDVSGVSYYPRITLLDHHRGSFFWASLYALKDVLRRPILQYIPEPHASLILSMTLGDDWRISPAFRQALVNSGTIHIISISGLHMTIITAAMFILFILAGLNRKWATGATLISMSLYIVMVGSSSAAIRSGIMSSLVLVGYVTGRLHKLLYALLLAAIVMLLWDATLLFDVGFQLSFGAMAGLAVFYPRFREWFYKGVQKLFNLPDSQGLSLLDAIPASLAASVAIFPVLAYHFGRFSPVGPLANLFILPAIPPLMILGFFTELTGHFAWPLWLLAEYHVRIISLFGSLL